MRNKVIEFFQNLPKKPEEQFNQAFELYRKSKDNSPSQVAFLNRAGYTDPLLENLKYDLKKLHNIREVDLRKKSTSKPKKKVIVEKGVVLPEFSKGLPGLKEMKDFATKNDIVVTGNNMEAYRKAIYVWVAEEREKNVVSEFLENASDNVKEYISLHDQFPFLDEDDCPQELKILVSDKRKAFRAYADAHAKLLFVAFNDEEKTEILDIEIYELASKALENFEVNQLIYKELNHYKEHKTILGEHPIFADLNLQKKIDEMSAADLAKRASNLDNYIRRDTNAAKKSNEPKKSELLLKVQQWKKEEGLVKSKLNSLDDKE